MTLTLIPTEQVDEEEATRAAWAIVAEAYERAAALPGVEADAHARFVRCARKVGPLADRPLLAVVKRARESGA